MDVFSRRLFMGSIATQGSAALIGGSLLVHLETCFGNQNNLQELPGLKGGRQIEQIEFIGERRVAVGEVTGEGLSGRLAYDLAQITPEEMVTANDQHFIRTRLPDRLDYEKRDPWSVQINGMVDEAVDLTIAELTQRTEEKGTFVMECSGNSAGRAFGLLSAASWDGVAITDLLDQVSIDPKATRVLISGFDDHSIEPGRGIEKSSSRGASWVFTFEELKNTAAFLAIRMNGEKLPKDHGFPVRLMVPGWYGCTCAKWVVEIKLVDDSFPATTQMLEFASRTHQSKSHELAKDYLPAEMDIAAIPIRVDRWEVDGETVYQIVGILWGGKASTDKLMIQCGTNTEPQPVELFSHEQNATWTLWRHTWRPKDKGRYRISLSIDDPEVKTRRLDRGYYDRRVEINATS